jgi:hypothetical protein
VCRSRRCAKGAFGWANRRDCIEAVAFVASNVATTTPGAAETATMVLLNRGHVAVELAVELRNATGSNRALGNGGTAWTVNVPLAPRSIKTVRFQS